MAQKSIFLWSIFLSSFLSLHATIPSWHGKDFNMGGIDIAAQKKLGELLDKIVIDVQQNNGKVSIVFRGIPGLSKDGIMIKQRGQSAEGKITFPEGYITFDISPLSIHTKRHVKTQLKESKSSRTVTTMTRFSPQINVSTIKALPCTSEGFTLEFTTFQKEPEKEKVLLIS